MTIALITDTETSGLPERGIPSDDPSQPHLVQLACKMVDLTTRTTIQSLNFLVYPMDWEFDQEAIDVHGITEEVARRYGRQEEDVSSIYYEMAKDSQMFVAHNVNFDWQLIRTAIMRHHGRDVADDIKHMEKVCTMLKFQKAHGGKWPKLEAAYEHYTGEKLDGAHDAMVDVNACEVILYNLIDEGFVTA